jgi:hypothetical protein
MKMSISLILLDAKLLFFLLIPATAAGNIAPQPRFYVFLYFFRMTSLLCPVPSQSSRYFPADYIRPTHLSTSIRPISFKAL